MSKHSPLPRCIWPQLMQVWLFIPPEVLEARRRGLAAGLMAKHIPPEWLLADDVLLPHCQLALQLPGQLMLLKPVGPVLKHMALSLGPDSWH